MRIHCLQHVDFEDPGTLLNWAGQNRYMITSTRLFQKGMHLPDIHSFDMLVIMGGPMGIYEEDKYPWLKAEKAFISKSILYNKKILGICLGAQLLADRLGSKVYKNIHTEIGWYPVRLERQSNAKSLLRDWPESFMAFHWHGDTFDLPDLAVPVGSSDACKNQGFLYGKNIAAFQFHLEMQAINLKRLINHGQSELKSGKYIQNEDQMIDQAIDHLAVSNQLLNSFLTRWATYHHKGNKP